MTVSAYIPCYNNAATIADVIASVRAQTRPVDELFVVDDGSSDGSADLAASLDVEVLRQAANRGRGHARHCAMTRARGEFVLCVDATNILPSGFLARALPWFGTPNVGAVFGRIVEERRRTAAERWRGRHLFKNDVQLGVRHCVGLCTYGTVLRASAVAAAGGFNASLRHSEDEDLGRRLLRSRHDVIFDPALHVASLADNSALEVLERYWRWYVGQNETFSLPAYARQTWYCLSHMVADDLKKRDPAVAAISLSLPPYILFKALAHRLAGTRQKTAAPAP